MFVSAWKEWGLEESCAETLQRRQRREEEEEEGGWRDGGNTSMPRRKQQAPRRSAGNPRLLPSFPQPLARSRTLSHSAAALLSTTRGGEGLTEPSKACSRDSLSPPPKCLYREVKLGLDCLRESSRIGAGRAKRGLLRVGGFQAPSLRRGLV